MVQRRRTYRKLVLIALIVRFPERLWATNFCGRLGMIDDENFHGTFGGRGRDRTGGPLLATPESFLIAPSSP
jgi:hypothetical protein